MGRKPNQRCAGGGHRVPAPNETATIAGADPSAGDDTPYRQFTLDVIDRRMERIRMTFVVPFDGSKLADTSLVRAVEFATALEEDVTAVTVVLERKRYAREGWIEEENRTTSRRLSRRFGPG